MPFAAVAALKHPVALVPLIVSVFNQSVAPATFQNTFTELVVCADEYVLSIVAEAVFPERLLLPA
jgi:hypothetical protein